MNRGILSLVLGFALYVVVWCGVGWSGVGLGGVCVKLLYADNTPKSISAVGSRSDNPLCSGAV